MLTIDNDGVKYLESIGFVKSSLANSLGQNRVFIKSNKQNPYVINMHYTTPVGSIKNSNGFILGKPAVGIFRQTLDDSNHIVLTEFPLFLGTIETMKELKIILKQIGIIDDKAD